MNKIFDKKSKPLAGRRQISVEPLEERILLSVDLIPYAPDDRDDADLQYEQDVEPENTTAETSEVSVETEPRELVLLDTSAGTLGDIGPALTDIGFGVEDGKRIVEVSSAEDIISALRGETYDAVHWLTHGSADALRVGGDFFDADIKADDPLVLAFEAALSAEGDLMLYGCDLGQGMMPERLALLTGADVAASINATGTGGDWMLEASVGEIETTALNLGDSIGTLGSLSVFESVLTGASLDSASESALSLGAFFEQSADAAIADGVFSAATIASDATWAAESHSLSDAAYKDKDPLEWIGNGMPGVVGYVQAAIASAGAAAYTAAFDEMTAAGTLDADSANWTAQQIERLEQAFVGSAEDASRTTAGSMAQALQANLVSNGFAAPPAQKLTSRILSLVSGINVRVDISTQTLETTIGLTGDWIGLPPALTGGFAVANGTISVTSKVVGDVVTRSQLAEMVAAPSSVYAQTGDISTFARMVAPDASGTSIDLSAVPAEHPFWSVTIGDENRLLVVPDSLDAASAVATALADLAAQHGLTLSASNNVLSAVKVADDTTATRLEIVASSEISVVDVPGFDATVSVVENGVSGDMALADVMGRIDDTVAADTYSLFDLSLVDQGTYAEANTFAVTPDVEVSKIKRYIRAVGGVDAVTGGQWVQAMPLSFGDSLLAGQFANSYATGGVFTTAPSFAPDARHLLGSLEVMDDIKAANSAPDVVAWLDELAAKVALSHPVGHDAMTLLGFQKVINDLRVLPVPVNKSVVTPATNKSDLDKTQLPVVRDGEAFVDNPDVGFGDLLGDGEADTTGGVDFAEQQVADLTTLPELAGFGVDTTNDSGTGLPDRDAILADKLELVADAIARGWLNRTDNSAAELNAVLSAIDFDALGLEAYTGNVLPLPETAEVSAFSLAYDSTANELKVDFKGLTLEETEGRRAVWGEIPLFANLGERVADTTLVSSLGFAYAVNDTATTQSDDLDITLGLDVRSADTNLAPLDQDLPGDPVVDMATLRLGLSQTFKLSPDGWNAANFSDLAWELSFDLDFSDPRGLNGTAAEAVLDTTYELSGDAADSLRRLNTGSDDLFMGDSDRSNALYLLSLRQSDVLIGEAFLNGLLSAPEMKAMIPVVGYSLADMIVNDTAGTLATADFYDFLVKDIAAAFDASENADKTLDETVNLFGPNNSVASSYSANLSKTGSAADGVEFDVNIDNASLPSITIDFAKLSTLALSGASYTLKPNASASVKARIRHQLTDVAGADQKLIFATTFHPGTGNGGDLFTLDLGLDTATEVGQLMLDLGFIGQQEIDTPTLDLEVAFAAQTRDVEVAGGTEVQILGGASPTITPAEASGSTVGYKFSLPINLNVTAESLPVDLQDDETYRLLDGVTPYTPLFEANGFAELSADDPRILLVNDAEWEMSLLLETLAERFNQAWLVESGGTSQLDRLLQRTVASSAGLSEFMNAPMALLKGASYFDLLQDPAASVAYSDLSDVILEHLAELNQYDMTGEAPMHPAGDADLVAFVDNLAVRLSEMAEVTKVPSPLLPNETGSGTPVKSPDSASFLENIGRVESADAQLLDEVRYRVTLRDLITLEKSVGQDALNQLIDLSAMGITLDGTNVDIDGYEFGLSADLNLNIDFGLKRNGGQFDPFVEMSEVTGNVVLSSTTLRDPRPFITYRYDSATIGDKVFSNLTDRQTLTFAPTFVYRPAEGALDFSGGIVADIEGKAQFEIGLKSAGPGAAGKLIVDLLPGARQEGRVFTYAGAVPLELADFAQHVSDQLNLSEVAKGDLVHDVSGTDLYRYLGDSAPTVADFTDDTLWKKESLITVQGIVSTGPETENRTITGVTGHGDANSQARGFLIAGGNTIRLDATEKGAQWNGYSIVIQPADDQISEPEVVHDVAAKTLTFRSPTSIDAIVFADLLEGMDNAPFVASLLWSEVTAPNATQRVYAFASDAPATLEVNSAFRLPATLATGSALDRLAIFADGTVMKAEITVDFADQKLSELPDGIKDLTYDGDIKGAIDRLNAALSDADGMFAGLLDVKLPFSGGQTIKDVLTKPTDGGSSVRTIGEALGLTTLATKLDNPDLANSSIGAAATTLATAYGKTEVGGQDVADMPDAVRFGYDVRSGELVLNFAPTLVVDYSASATLRREQLAALLGLTVGSPDFDAGLEGDRLTGDAKLYVEPNFKIMISPEGEVRLGTGAQGQIDFTIASGSASAQRAADLTEADKSISLLPEDNVSSVSLELDGETAGTANASFDFDAATLDVLGDAGRFSLSVAPGTGGAVSMDAIKGEVSLAALQSQVNRASEVSGDVSDKADDVVQAAILLDDAQATLKEVEDRIKLLPSYVSGTTSDLADVAKADDLVLADKLEQALSDVAAATTAFDEKQAVLAAAKAALDAVVADIQSARQQAVDQFDTSTSETEMAGALGVLQDRADAAIRRLESLGDVAGTVVTADAATAAGQDAKVRLATEVDAVLVEQARLENRLGELSAAVKDVVARVALPASDPLAQPTAIAQALDAIEAQLVVVNAQISRASQSATALTDRANAMSDVGDLTAALAAVVAGLQDADAIGSSLADYILQVQRATSIDLDVARDTMDAITLAEALYLRAGQEVVKLAETLRAAATAVANGQTVDSRLSQVHIALTALETLVANAQTLKVAAQTQIDTAADAYDNISGLPSGVTKPDWDVVTAARLDAIDLVALTDAIALFQNAVASNTALQDNLSALQAAVSDNGAVFDRILGDFESENLPNIDFSTLALALKANEAQASFESSSEKVLLDFLATATLPATVSAGSGEAVEAVNAFTPPSMSDLRFGMLSGLDQVVLPSADPQTGALSGLAKTIADTLDAMLAPSSSATGTAVFYQDIPLLGKSLAELINLDDRLDQITGLIASAPTTSIAQLDAIVNKGLGDSPLSLRLEAPGEMNAGEVNRLNVILEIRADQLIGEGTALDLSDFAEFFGIPTPEIPLVKDLVLDLSGTVVTNKSEITLTQDEVRTLLSGTKDDTLANGDRLRLRDSNGTTLATGVVRSVDYTFGSGQDAPRADFYDSLDANNATAMTVLKIDWQGDFDPADVGDIVRDDLNADRVLITSPGVGIASSDANVTFEMSQDAPLLAAFQFGIDLSSVSTQWDGFDASALSQHIGKDIAVIRDGAVVGRGLLASANSSGAGLVLNSGTLRDGDSIKLRTGAQTSTTFTGASDVTYLPMETVDEFGTRAGADLVIGLAPKDGTGAGSLMEFRSGVFGADSVKVAVTGGTQAEPLELGRTALRLKLDDGLPDFEPIVAAFEPSRLVPTSAFAFKSDAMLDVTATVVADKTYPLDLGTADLSALYVDGKYTAPKLGFANGTLVDAMTAALSQDGAILAQMAAGWEDLTRFEAGFSDLLGQVVGDLDRKDGLLDMVIPGLGQSVEEMTGVKSSLRAALSALEEAGDQSLDYAAGLIHQAMTDATDPLSFKPDELAVSLMPDEPDATSGVSEAVILSLKGTRILNGEIDFGMDLSELPIGNLEALKSVLNLDQPGLLSISAQDQSYLRYALSLGLDLTVRIGWDDSADQPTVTFVKQDLQDGTFKELADGQTAAPLELRVLGDLGPTDVSFALDAGSLGTFGVIAEDTRFVLGRSGDITPKPASDASLSAQLGALGARLAVEVDHQGSVDLSAEGGFGMGLALSRMFGEALQPIDGFQDARFSGLISAPSDVSSTMPVLDVQFLDVPTDLNLRSLLMPQLDDFSSFSVTDLIDMTQTALKWVRQSNDATATSPVLDSELPFIGQSLSEMLPISDVFETIETALTALSGQDFVQAALTLEETVNDALSSLAGWVSPPVFGLNFSTLPGSVWNGVVPLRGLEMTLNFDEAVVFDQALALDLAKALGLDGIMEANMSALLEAGVGLSGTLVFGGALSSDASLQSLGSLADDPNLTKPVLYVGGGSGLTLGFNAGASDVAMKLGFDVGSDALAASVSGGEIYLGGAGGEGQATLRYGLPGISDDQSADGIRQAYHLIDTAGTLQSAAAGAVDTTGVAAAQGGSITYVTLDSALVTGSSQRLVNVGAADGLVNDQNATDEQYIALGKQRIGIVLAGGEQMLLHETGIGSAQTSLKEGDSLHRVIVDATYDVTVSDRTGQTATVNFAPGSGISAANYDGLSHALLEFDYEVGGQTTAMSLPLPIVLPEDLSEQNLRILLPAGVLSDGTWSNVRLTGLAPGATVVSQPEPRPIADLPFVYDVTFDSHSAEGMALLAALDGVSTASGPDASSVVFGPTDYNGRTVMVHGRVLSTDATSARMVLDTEDVLLQQALRSGDVAAIGAALNALDMYQGDVPLFNPESVAPELNGEISVDLTAVSDLIGQEIGSLSTTMDLSDFAKLDVDPNGDGSLSGLKQLFDDLGTAAGDQAVGIFSPAMTDVADYLSGQLDKVTAALANLSSITPAQLVSYIRSGLDAVVNGEGTAANLLRAEIPFVGKSLNELTNLKTILAGVLDQLPTGDQPIQEWLDAINNDPSLPRGLINLSYTDLEDDKWSLSVDVDYAKIIQVANDVTLSLGDFGDLGPISGSALSDGVDLEMRLDGTAALALNLELHGDGLSPVELRLLDSSGLDLGFGMRLAQETGVSLGLSESVKDLLDTFAGSGTDVFAPDLAINGAVMWLSSDPNAQQQTLTLSRRLPDGGTASFAQDTFEIGQVLTTSVAQTFVGADAKYGIVTGWDHTSGTLTMLAPSGTVTDEHDNAVSVNSFTTQDRLRPVVDAKVQSGGFTISRVDRPEASELRTTLVNGADRYFASGDLIAADDGSWTGAVVALDQDELIAVNQTGALNETATLDRLVEFSDGTTARFGELANSIDANTRILGAVGDAATQPDQSVRYEVTLTPESTGTLESGHYYLDDAGRWFVVKRVSDTSAWLQAVGHNAAPVAGGALHSPSAVVDSVSEITVSPGETVQRVTLAAGTPVSKWLMDVGLLHGPGGWFRVSGFDPVARTVDLQPVDTASVIQAADTLRVAPVNVALDGQVYDVPSKAGLSIGIKGADDAGYARIPFSTDQTQITGVTSLKPYDLSVEDTSALADATTRIVELRLVGNEVASTTSAELLDRDGTTLRLDQGAATFDPDANATDITEVAYFGVIPGATASHTLGDLATALALTWADLSEGDIAFEAAPDQTEKDQIVDAINQTASVRLVAAGGTTTLFDLGSLVSGALALTSTEISGFLSAIQSGAYLELTTELEVDDDTDNGTETHTATVTLADVTAALHVDAPQWSGASDRLLKIANVGSRLWTTTDDAALNIDLTSAAPDAVLSQTATATGLTRLSASNGFAVTAIGVAETWQRLTVDSVDGFGVGTSVEDTQTGATGTIRAIYGDADQYVAVELDGATGFGVSPATGATDTLRQTRDDIGYRGDMSASIGLFVPVSASLGGDGAVAVMRASAGLDGATFALPELVIPAGLVDFLTAEYQARVEQAMGALSNLSYADVLDGVITALDVILGESDGDGLIDAQIPVIGKSLDDLTGISALRDAFNTVKASGAQTLDGVEGAIRSALEMVFGDLGSGTVSVELAPVAGSSNSQMRANIRVENLDFQRSERLEVSDADLSDALGVDLGPLKFNGGGQVDIAATSNMVFDLLFEVETTAPLGQTPEVSVYLSDETGIDFAIDQMVLTPVGATSIDLGFAEGTAALTGDASIEIDAGTMTLRNIEDDLSSLVGLTLQQSNGAIFKVLAFKPNTGTSADPNGVLKLERIKGAIQTADDTSADVTEVKTTGPSFGNRILTEYDMNGDPTGHYIDMWFGQAPSNIGDLSVGFEGWDSATRAATDESGMLLLADGTSVEMVGTEVLTKGLRPTGAALAGQTLTLTMAAPLTAETAPQIGALVPLGNGLIGRTTAATVGGSTVTLDLSGEMTLPTLVGTELTATVNGSSASVDLLQAPVLRAGVVIDAIALNGDTGRATIKLSETLGQADLPPVGTAVTINGLDAVVIGRAVDTDLLEVAFTGEVRPVAQGQGVRLSLPLMTQLSDGTTTFDVTKAGFADDGRTLQLTLESGGEADNVQEVEAKLDALRELKPGMVLSSADASYVVLSTDPNGGTVDVLWLAGSSATPPAVHKVGYDSDQPSFEYSDGTANQSIDVSQVTVTEDGVLYLFAKDAENSTTQADHLESLADSAAGASVTINGEAIDTDRVAVSEAKRTVFISHSAIDLAAGSVQTVDATPAMASGLTQFLRNAGTNLSSDPVYAALRPVAQSAGVDTSVTENDVTTDFVRVLNSAGATNLGISSIFSGIGLFSNLPIAISGGIGDIDLPTLPALDLGFDFSLPSINFGLGDLGLPDVPGLNLPDFDVPNLVLPSLPGLPSLDIPFDLSLPDLPDLPGIGAFPSLPDFDISMPDLDFTGLFGDLNVGSSLTALIDLIETVSASIVTEGEIGNDILTTELPLLNFSLDSKLGIVPLFRSISSVVAGLDDNLMQMQQLLDAELATLGFDVGLGADGKPVDSRVTVARVNYDDPSNQDNRNDLVFGINIRKLVSETVDTDIDLAAVMAGMDNALAGPLAKLFAMNGNFKGAFEMSAGLMLDLVLNLDDVRAPKAFIGADSDLYVDFDVVTDQADMEVSFEVGEFAAEARTGTSEADPFVFEMVNRDGSALAPDANTRFLKMGLNGDGLSTSRLSVDQIALELTSEESLQVSVPVYAGIEHDSLGSFETKVVDFDLSFDPGQFISETRPELFVYQDANAPTAAAFSAFRQTGVVAVSYQFADEFSFDTSVLDKLMAAANQPLNFTDLFKQMQGVVNGVKFATTTVEVPFVGETIAGLIGIEDEANTVFSKLDDIFTDLITATTPDSDDETDGTVKSLDFINDKIRTLLFKDQQDQVDGLLFNAGFTFGRNAEDKLVANAVNVTFDLSFFALLQVHNIIDVDRTVRQTLRPADYLPREQLNMLRALGVDIDLEMDPIDLLFNFDIGVKGSISLGIGGTSRSPTYTTTLHEGAGVYIGFGARAFVEQAQLKAGLTFVPGAQMTASVLDATFALDADGDVERDGAGRIIDDGLAVVEYVTSSALVASGTTTNQTLNNAMTLNTKGHAALMVPIYFPTKSAPLTGSSDVIDDDFLTDEAGRYAKYASTKMDQWTGADVQRNAIFIGYDLTSTNLTNASDLVNDSRFYYYVPNPMPQIGLGMFINDPLLLIDGLSSVLDALDKTIR